MSKWSHTGSSSSSCGGGVKISSSSIISTISSSTFWISISSGSVSSSSSISSISYKTYDTRYENHFSEKILQIKQNNWEYNLYIVLCGEFSKYKDFLLQFLAVKKLNR